MRINTNLTAMNTFTQYTANNSKIASAVAKLSSGYAINTAADNAAGLAISEKMRAQIRGLTKASANAQDAISLVQTAEGSLGEATEILQRMRELAVQAASDTNQDEIDRAALQDEFAQLQQELNDIASTTTFNKKNLLDGSLAATKRTVTNVKLANSGMAVSIGKAAAGKYSFQVVVRKESEAVDAVTAKATAAGGNVAKATFEDIGADNVAKEGALYNGNYTLETEIKDGTLTVKAAGDNGQTFYAKVEKSTIENFEDNWGSLSDAEKILTLKFESGDGANDGFEVNLTFKNPPSTSENGLLALKNAIDDVTVSLDGGVNAQDASYGVYATLTGGEAVKLNAGDTSVTFSNGVTVSFDKLTATDVQVTKETTLEPGTSGTVNLTSGSISVSVDEDVGSTFTIDLNGIASGYVANQTRDYTINIGGTDYHVTINGTEADEAAVRNKIGEAIANSDTPFTATFGGKDSEGNPVSEVTATFTASYDEATGILTFSTTDTAGYTDVSFGDVSFSGSYDYTKEPGTSETVNLTPGSISVSVDESVGSTFTIDLKGIASGYVANQTRDYTINIGGTAYNVTIDGTEADEAAVLNKIGEAIANSATPFTATFDGKNSEGNSVSDVPATFTASYDEATGILTFSTKDTAGYTEVSFGNVSFSGSYDYTNYTATEDVALSSGILGKIGGTDEFGNATTTSTFDVTESAGKGLTFQVGANRGDEMVINLDSVNCESLGINSAKVTTQEAAAAAIEAVDNAINKVSSQRAYLGAIQNRLEYKINNLETSTENLTSAESQIRDVDMAKEMTEFTNANILQQAATAMLAQANSLPQNVLSLIRG